MIKNQRFSAAGIIAEYNPLHHGHRYQIEQTRNLTGADYVVAVMSGDFVQRGTPAIFDKYTRTAMALQSGVDLVIEMPAVFATSSAEDFASCGVALLEHLGVVGSICFGSECGDIQSLSRIATILAHEPEPYTAFLKEQLRLGTTFPKARSLALQRYLTDTNTNNLALVLNSPNNILGIEYCKALIRRNSPICPYTISRAGSGYHDTKLSELSEDFCSASAIRKALLNHTDLDILASQIPESAYVVMKDKKPLFPHDFSAALNTTLLHLIKANAILSDYADVSEELESRILRYALDFCTFEERINQLKTKQYTYTRVSRALLHLMLGIKKTDVERYRARDYAPYARVLGFRQSSGQLLAQIKRHSSIPLITKVADARQILSPEDYIQLELDFHCSHIYNSMWNARYHAPIKNEYNRPIMIQ